MEEETILDAKNGDTSLLSEVMVEEEEKLREARLKEEKKQGEPEELVHLNDTQFTRLDELLTQTQMYSEFLLEKMEDITFVFPSHLSFAFIFTILIGLVFSDHLL